jgi:hypothetical protein
MSLEVDSFSKQINEGQKNLILGILSRDKDEFLQYWRLWKHHQNFEALDYDSLILFPLFYDKIEKFNIVDDNIPRYKGIIRKNWVLSSTNETYVNELRARFKNQNISFLLYDESAINSVVSELKYPIKSSAISILVNRSDLKKSVKIIEKIGFQASFFSKLKRLLFFRNYVLLKKNQSRVKIYFRPVNIPLNSVNKNNLLKKSIIENVIDKETCTYHIYYQIIRSQTEHSKPKIDWIIYLFLIESQFQIDWKLFVELTVKDHLHDIILPAFQYLNSLDQTKFPSFVIEDLIKSKKSCKCKLAHYFAKPKKSILHRVARILYFRLNRLFN